MPNTISDKLKIKAGNTLLTLNAPKDFKQSLTGLPAGVKINLAGKEYQQIHWFVLNKAQLEKEMSKVMKLLKEDCIVWVYYPKGTSKIQTDLTRDKGWEYLRSERDKLTWISLISFNETWSVFGFRAKTAADKKKEAKPATREIFNWVNPTTKVVMLPNDFFLALKKNNAAGTFFNSLSFSNKKEYIEWIVTAKRMETRAERITDTVERLVKNWKNPRNI